MPNAKKSAHRTFVDIINLEKRVYRCKSDRTNTWILREAADVHGKVEAEELLDAVVDERVEIGAERTSHTRRADHVLEYEIPADDERQELADGHVCVDVGATGLGHARSELGIAKASEHLEHIHSFYSLVRLIQVKCSSKLINSLRMPALLSETKGSQPDRTRS